MGFKTAVVTTSSNSEYSEDAAHSSGATGTFVLAVRSDAGSALAADGDYIPFMVNSAGALYVTGGGGTEYTEDVATPATILGTTNLMERDDILSTLTPAAADWAAFRCSEEGALWTQDFNSDSALTALQLIDNAISGAGFNITQQGGVAVTLNTGARDAGTQRVTIATDDSVVVTATNLDVQSGGADLATQATLSTIDTDTGDIVTAVQIIDNAIHVDDAAFTLGTHSGIMMMGFAGTQSVAANDAAALACDTDGALHIADGSNSLTVDAPVGTPVFVRLSDGSSAVDPATLGSDTYTEATTVGSVVAGVRNDALGALAGTDNELAPFQMNASGALYTALATVGSAAQAISLDGGNTDAGTIRVTMATDTAGVISIDDNSGNISIDDGGNVITVNVASGGIASGGIASGALASGSVASGAIASGAIASGAIALGAIAAGNTSIAEVEDADSAAGDTGVKVFLIRDDALAANMGVNADGDLSFFRANNDGALWVQPTVGSLGGCKSFDSVDLDETDEQVSGIPCTVYSIYCWNATAGPLWMQMHNETAANAAIGCDTPQINFLIPGNADSDGAGLVFPIPVAGVAFSTALSVAITGAAGADATDPGASAAGAVIMYQN